MTAPESPASTGPLSKSRGDMLVERFMSRFKHEVQIGIDAYTADGAAFGQVDRSPWSAYNRLLALQASGDPQYWANPQAQADLAALSQQFGPPPPMTTPPFGTEIANRPPQQFNAGLDVQQQGGDLGYAAPEILPGGVM